MESFINLGAELKLDVLDIRTDKGWGSKPGDTSGGLSSEVSLDYLIGVKRLALEKGLCIGYLASIGHFTGTPEENAELVPLYSPNTRPRPHPSAHPPALHPAPHPTCALQTPEGLTRAVRRWRRRRRTWTRRC